MESSISLEETNKIRVRLGLKPLVDDGAPVDTKEKEANDNFAANKERELQAKKKSEIVTRIEKSRNKHELNRKLVGATLGDADDDVDDTVKWIKKSKKREKALAAKRSAEIDGLDKLYQEYTEKDLAGLKVSHDLDALQEGEDRILTLKDSRILDNEEDELHNVELAEAEKDAKRHELKTKRRDYTGYDDDEFDPGMQGTKRAVLAKYDEDIDGPARTDFRLGGGGPVGSAERPTKVDTGTTISVNKSLLSIDYAKNIETSDYLQEGDIGFKKPKTKKKRSTRRPVETEVAPLAEIPATNLAGDDAIGMDIDVKPELPNLDTNFVDDEDLQAVLAQSRRRKVRKMKMSPEEIAAKVAAERVAEEEAERLRQETADKTENDGLTFDDTSEFVRAISYTPAPVRESIIIKIDTSHMQDADEDNDQREAGDEMLAELEADAIKEEEMEEDETEAMLRTIEDAIKDSEVKTEDNEGSPADQIGTSNEQTFGAGMASTLNILRQQGIIPPPSSDIRDREHTQLNRDRWLAEHRYRLAQRELERLRSRSTGKDQATREYENRQREQQEAREALEAFKDYKPDVDIKYHDEFGRVLTTKEAWKALSHKFHGKGSGRMKTEKRLKKIAEEKKREAMGSGDTPLSMNAAFQIRQERAGQAHMVLSVGNRGAVPQATEFLDSGIISKKEKGKGKKKDTSKGTTPAIDMTGFTATTLPGSGTPLGANISSGAVISALPTTSSDSPGSGARSGFTRVIGETSAGVSGVASPGSIEDRGKVQFGFGSFGSTQKRKAVEDGDDGPAVKRR